MRTSMQAADVTETRGLARATTGVDRIRVVHRLRLLSDNGPGYVSAELAAYLERLGLAHTRGAPYHPMTQGKIERYHRSMKNVVKLEKYYSPWDNVAPSRRLRGAAAGVSCSTRPDQTEDAGAAETREFTCNLVQSPAGSLSS